MKERLLALAIAGVTISAAATVTGASAQARSGAHVHRRTSHRPVLQLGRTIAGPVLVDHRGYTIYMFTKDARNKDNCAAIHNCLRDWPAVTTTGRPVIGPGIKRSLVGTIPYKGTLREVTYDGRPLHTYKYDTSPRSVQNIGNTQYGGAWWALTADGKLVK